MPDLTKNPFYGLHLEVEAKKPKAKKPPEDISWKKRYADAHKKWWENEYPEAWKAGYYTPPKYPDTRTANGLQNAMSEHMKWCGGIGNRINNIGLRGRKSTTINGTADMDLTFCNGKNAKAEVKVGKDRPSPDQLKMQKRVRATGGIYEFIHTMQEYYYLYDKIVSPELFM